MARVTIRWASEELSQTLAELTSQQARGVVRIVQAELEGRTLSSLLDCPGQICTSTTYYREGGWKDKSAFRRALMLARRDWREWLLQESTGEALMLLAETAPEAVRALRQQIVGDRPAVAALEMALAASEAELRANAARRLGQTGLPIVVPALAAALMREREVEVQEAIVEALGMVAGARDSDRRTAAFGVLDRADKRTATKQMVGVGEWSEVTDDELAAIEEALREQARAPEGDSAEQAEGGGETE